MTVKEKRDIKRKLNVINYAKKTGNVNKTCRHYGVSKTIYYEWIKKYKKQGEKGLINQKPCPENLKLRTPIEIEEEVIYLRKKYHFIVIICYSSLHLLNTLHRKQKIPSTCTVTGI